MTTQADYHQPHPPWPRVRVSMLGLWAISWAAISLGQSTPTPADPEHFCDTTTGSGTGAPVVPVALHPRDGVPIQQDGLLVPEPVLLYVVPLDSDELWVYCLGQCSPLPIAGRVCATWSFASAVEDPGVFIDARGRAQPSEMKSNAVLWLPPRDLAPGEAREVRIRARLEDDHVPGLGVFAPEDGATRIAFRAVVTRSAQPGTYYSVAVELDPQESYVPDPQEPCESESSACCTLLGLRTTPDEPIHLRFDEEGYPVHGMITHEDRVIGVEAWDVDVTNWECGVPPCPSVHPDDPPRHFDRLRFSWNILEGVEVAEIVHSHPASPSIVLRTHQRAGRVRLEVRAVNATSGSLSYPEPYEEREVSFQVYGLTWVDQSNSPVARLLPTWSPHYSATWQQVGVCVSTASLESDPLTGCTGGSDAELFAGQYTQSPDPNTYRLEIDSTDAPSGNSYRVRIRVRRAVLQGGFWDVLEPYDETFETVSDGHRHRMRQDVRLVSNADPGHGHPSAVYDDEVCGRQTILVRLGDWVDAELLVKGPKDPDFQPVGSIELPVERPWSEPANGLPRHSWSTYGPRSILSFPMRLTYSDTSPFFGDATKVIPHGSWAEASQRMADQVSEDFAQTGMICTLADHRPGRPLVNSLFVRQPTSAAPIQQGLLRIQLHWGVPHVLEIQISEHSVAQQVAGQVVGAIKALLDPQETGFPIIDCWRFYGQVGHPQDAEGYFVFVARGAQDVWMNVLEAPTNMLIARFDAPYTGAPAVLSHYAAAEFAANNRLDIYGMHGDPQDDKEIDILVMNAFEIWAWNGTLFVPNQGWSYHAQSLDPGDLRWNAVFIAAGAGNGSDLDVPLVLGHEVGHHLLRRSTHSSVQSNLMYEDLSAGEVPDGPKRLSNQDVAQPNQIVTAREPDTPRAILIQIPERRR